MIHTIKKDFIKMRFCFLMILSILLITLSPLSLVQAASSGSYISVKIGEESLTGFLTFKVLNQNTPPDTSITYQFAGSKDNFQSWSDKQSVIDSCDLSKISQLTSSKYLKVKINLEANSGNLPTVGGFEVAYETLVTTAANGGATSSGTDTSQQSVKNLANIQSNGDQSQAASTTKTQKISLTQNQLRQNKLTANGGNLWVNLGIALLLTAILIYFLFRKKQTISPFRE